ncbi:terpene synthase family protein [Nocardia sp. NPDC023852]|uniref:terpene synthase family protein n=1 Tax=Nocardia sp. NPDC023852 TaxID=3154697 RepID=UPI0033D9DD2C
MPNEIDSAGSPQPPQTDGDALLERVLPWLRSWLLDTGLALSPAEADNHRWGGATIGFAAKFLAPADPAREQSIFAAAALAALWDDLFEDPQLRDPEAVTALRRGLVATLRQDPEAPWRPGAIPTAWASLWPRLREGRTTRWQERFLNNLEEWCEACEREAHHRINGYIPPTADYLPLRMSTGGFETFIAGMEVHQNRELPSKLRDHRVIRRLEELVFWVVFVENDMVGLDQDEADQVPYNLVRMIRHETGCTRDEAVEQVQRQVAEYRAKLDAVIRYLPIFFRVAPCLSGRWKKFESTYQTMTKGGRAATESRRNTPTSASAAPDLERLRREVYLPAAEPIPTAP